MQHALRAEGAILMEFKFSNKLVVGLFVLAFKIAQEATTFVDLANESSARRKVLLMCAQMAGKFINLGREKSNLDLRRPCVVFMSGKLLDQILLLLLAKHRGRASETWVEKPVSQSGESRIMGEE